ncbi:MAG: hypothetical protein ACRC9L_00445 [Brevinema sp.]
MRFLLLIGLIISTHTSIFSQMKNIPIFPAGITVEWRVLPTVEPTEPPTPPAAQQKEGDSEEKNTKPSKWRRPRLPANKKNTEESVPENLTPLAPVEKSPDSVVASEPVSVNRLIRVINAIDLDPDQRFALVFYNDKGNMIPKQLRVVPNTEKPSAARVFFMDKASTRLFKGLLDIYFVPKDAVFMNVAIIDQNDKIIRVPSHPSYNDKGFISIEDFLKTEPSNRIMLQFEVAGSSEKGILRLGGFRFGKAR